MNNLTVPVVQILRRLFNVVSALALAQRYVGHATNPKYAFQKVEETWDGVDEVKHVLGGSASLRSTDEVDENVTAPSLLTQWSAYLTSALSSGEQAYEDDRTNLQHDAISNMNANPDPLPPPEPRDISSIQQLLLNPTLFDPVRKPRFPIVLCHGLYGFDVRGPSSFPMLQMHYWSNVLRVLKDTVGAEVIVTGVPSTGSIASRAHAMHAFLSSRAPGRALNFMAHSMGGLDCRYLISRVRKDIEEGRTPETAGKGGAGIMTSGRKDGTAENLDRWGDFEGWSDLDVEGVDGGVGKGTYVPVSLTTICTPHRGSPVMDWFAENIGLGKPLLSGGRELPKDDDTRKSDSANARSLSALSSLPSSFTTLLLSLLDTPAYANLTTSYVNDVFNPSTPNDPRVRYYSVGARIESLGVWHPLWFPKMVMDGAEEKEKKTAKTVADSHFSEFQVPQSDDWGNDGLVSVHSAKWGEFLGVVEGCEHWAIRGSRGLTLDNPSFPTISLASLSMPSLSSLGEVVPSTIRNSFGEFGMWQRRRSTKSGSATNSSAGDDGESWSWLDWSRFVRAWKREEAREARAEKAEADKSTKLSVGTPGPSAQIVKQSHGGGAEKKISKSLGASTEADSRPSASSSDVDEDEVVKSSTDKLSKVFDWIVEQPPTSSSSGSSDGNDKTSSSSAAEEEPSATDVLEQTMARSRSASSPSSATISTSAPSSAPSTGQHSDRSSSPSPLHTTYPVTSSSNHQHSQSYASSPSPSQTRTRPSEDSRPKFDLERFYVALCRKLYDDGL